MTVQVATSAKVLEVVLPEVKSDLELFPRLCGHIRIYSGHDHRQNKVEKDLQEDGDQYEASNSQVRFPPERIALLP